MGFQTRAGGSALMAGSFRLDCAALSTRAINQTLRQLLAEGVRDIVLTNPAGRHNLGVALRGEGRITLEGDAGYYAAAMLEGPSVRILGNCGWGTAENMMRGEVVVEGSAGNATGATIRGGTLVVKGHASSRTGISQKGGLILVGGNSGYMTGFMMQKGVMVICGDVGEALGDSMYEGTIYVGGRIAELGNDAVLRDLQESDLELLDAQLARYGIPGRFDWKKVVSGRRLWNFSKKEMGVWIHAL